MTKGMKYKCESIGKRQDYITRESVFRNIWINKELTDFNKTYIYDEYPELFRIHNCIREFRNVFAKQNVPHLYLYIEKYRNETIKPLGSFAKGLKRDIDAVKNEVAYGYSNGFVE